MRLPIVISEKRPLTFVDGVGAGIFVAALVPLIYFLVRGESFAAMYRDFGNVRLPLTTRMVLDPVWRSVVPGLLVAVAIWVLVRRPAFRYAMVVVAAVTLLAVVFTYVAAYWPIWMLAGNIR